MVDYNVSWLTMLVNFHVEQTQSRLGVDITPLDAQENLVKDHQLNHKRYIFLVQN